MSHQKQTHKYKIILHYNKANSPKQHLITQSTLSLVWSFITSIIFFWKTINILPNSAIFTKQLTILKKIYKAVNFCLSLSDFKRLCLRITLLNTNQKTKQRKIKLFVFFHFHSHHRHVIFHTLFCFHFYLHKKINTQSLIFLFYLF